MVDCIAKKVEGFRPLLESLICQLPKTCFCGKRSSAYKPFFLQPPQPNKNSATTATAHDLSLPRELLSKFVFQFLPRLWAI